MKPAALIMHRAEQAGEQEHRGVSIPLGEPHSLGPFWDRWHASEHGQGSAPKHTCVSSLRKGLASFSFQGPCFFSGVPRSCLPLRARTILSAPLTLQFCPCHEPIEPGSLDPGCCSSELGYVWLGGCHTHCWATQSFSYPGKPASGP